MNIEFRKQIRNIVGNIMKVKLLEEQGCTSEVHQIITDSGTYILKSSYKDIYREWLWNESQVLEKLHNQKQISVPKFYGFIENENSSHLIMSFEKGVSLTTALSQAKNETEKLSLIRSFGRFLYQLHNTRIIESLDHKSNWLDRMLEVAEENLKKGETDGDQKLLKKLKETKPQQVSQTMIHGDCTTDNVLVIDGDVRFFIDVAFMTVGDPRYDEALAIRSFIDNEKNAFYEGYKHYRISKEEFQYFDEGLYEFF